MKNSISIIIPILNERKNIKKLFNQINKKLFGINYEIIYVDDKSTDGSIDVLKELN